MFSDAPEWHSERIRTIAIAVPDDVCLYDPHGEVSQGLLATGQRWLDQDSRRFVEPTNWRFVIFYHREPSGAR